MMAFLNVSSPSIQQSLPMQKTGVDQSSIKLSHAQGVPTSPGSNPVGPLLKLKVESPNRQSSDNPRLPVLLDRPASALTDQGDADRSASSTSPGSQQLSQFSISSHKAQSPNTAASSIAPEDDLHHSPVKRVNRMSAGFSPQVETFTIDDSASRSPSATPLDGTGRASARSRKPTSKAQALADAGTRFYRRLKRTSDGSTHEKEISQQEDDKLIDKQGEQASLKNASLHVTDQASPDLIRSSVEQPIAAAVRSSPRQRKPTAKAAASELEPTSRKRTASPSDGGRSTKIVKLSLSTPRQPSKLRKRLSRTPEEDFNPEVFMYRMEMEREERRRKESKIDATNPPDSQPQQCEPPKPAQQEFDLETPQQPSKLRKRLSRTPEEDFNPEVFMYRMEMEREERRRKESKIDATNPPDSQSQQCEPPKPAQQEFDLETPQQTERRSTLAPLGATPGTQSIPSSDFSQDPKQNVSATIPGPMYVKKHEADASEAGRSPVGPETAVTICDLTCLNPTAALLAFAKFAATEETDSDDDDNDDDTDGGTGIGSTFHNGDFALSSDKMAKFVKTSCLCNYHKESGKSSAEVLSSQRNVSARGTKSATTGSQPKRILRNKGISSLSSSREQALSQMKTAHKPAKQSSKSKQSTENNNLLKLIGHRATGSSTLRQSSSPPKESRQATQGGDEARQKSFEGLAQSKPLKVLRLITKPQADRSEKKPVKNKRHSSLARSDMLHNGNASRGPTTGQAKSITTKRLIRDAREYQTSDIKLKPDRKDEQHSDYEPDVGPRSTISSILLPPEILMQTVQSHQQRNSSQIPVQLSTGSPRNVGLQKAHKSQNWTGRASSDYEQHKNTSLQADTLAPAADQPSTSSLKITLKVHAPSI